MVHLKKSWKLCPPPISCISSIWLFLRYILFFFNLLFTYKFIYFIYLFLAALGLRCCAWAFSSCGEQGLLFVVARRLLVAVASLVAEHRL